MEALLTQPTVARTGYVLDGWFQNSGFTGSAWDFATDKMPAANISLYAKWSVDTTVFFDATFVSNGGTPAPAVQSKNVEALLTQPAIARAGYTLDGWYQNAGFTGSAWDFATDKMPAADITLYAKWSVDTTVLFDATFVANGGTPAPAAQSKNVEALLTQPTLARTGYVLDGWFRNSSFTGSAWDFATDKMPAADITLYAKWTVDTTVFFKATFVANSGTPAPVVQSKNAESLLTQPIAMTRAGYTFAGWYQTATFTGNAWNFATDAMPNKDITLYAKWDTAPYKVNYYSNGTLIHTADVKFGDLLTSQAAPTAPAGMKFNGWIVDGNTAKVWNFAKDTMPSQALRLDAWWVAADVSGGGTSPGSSSGSSSSRATSATSSRTPVASSSSSSSSSSNTSSSASNTVINPTSSTPKATVSSGAQISSTGTLPLAEDGNWALINVLLTGLGVVASILLLATMFKKKQVAGVSGNSGMMWRILAILASVLSTVLLLATSQFAMQMVIVNKWTILAGLLAVVQAVFILAMLKSRRPKASDEFIYD